LEYRSCSLQISFSQVDPGDVIENSRKVGPTRNLSIFLEYKSSALVN